MSFAFTCDGEDDPDSGCGCARSFAGFTSHKATTTALVVDQDITPEQFLHAYRAAMTNAGWLTGKEDPLLAEFDADAHELLDIAASYPAGTVVERRLDGIHIRVCGPRRTDLGEEVN